MFIRIVRQTLQDTLLGNVLINRNVVDVAIYFLIAISFLLETSNYLISFRAYISVKDSVDFEVYPVYQGIPNEVYPIYSINIPHFWLYIKISLKISRAVNFQNDKSKKISYTNFWLQLRVSSDASHLRGEINGKIGWNSQRSPDSVAKISGQSTFQQKYICWSLNSFKNRKRGRSNPNR